MSTLKSTTASLVTLIASIFAVGCAKLPTGAQLVASGSADLVNAPLCCKTLADAQREPLPAPNAKEPTKLTIDKQSQAHVFGGSKAFFRMYELPKYSRPYSILISSHAGGNLQDAALFIPRVALFDSNYQLTRYFEEKTLRNRGNSLERTVFVNPEDQRERYIAIYGSDLTSSIERAYSMLTVETVVAGPVMFNLHSGHDGKSLLRSSPTGQVIIEVQTLGTSAPGQ